METIFQDSSAFFWLGSFTRVSLRAGYSLLLLLAQAWPNPPTPQPWRWLLLEWLVSTAATDDVTSRVCNRSMKIIQIPTTWQVEQNSAGNSKYTTLDAFKTKHNNLETWLDTPGQMRIKFVITKCSFSFLSYSFSIILFSILFFLLSLSLFFIIISLLSLVVVLSQQHLGLLSSDVVSLDVDQPVQEQTIFQMLSFTAEARNIWKCKSDWAHFYDARQKWTLACYGNETKALWSIV